MRISDDLKSSTWIHIKGWLFLVLVILAGGGLLIQNLSWENLFLLLICLWAACRWYYYAFYVVEKYVDPEYRYAGLGSMIKYLLAHRQK